MKNKVILTDCDGVLVDWLYAFDAWMRDKGYNKVRSDVYELELCYNIPRAEMGYVFYCITSLSLDPNAAKLREQNIKALFGETAFAKVICLDTGADKDEALLPYLDSGCIWVEDKIENADLGSVMGLAAILMSNESNKNYDGDATVVDSWKEIYEML